MSKAPMYLPEGYKTSTKTTSEKNDKATIITTSHFNGSVDKTVQVKAIRLSFTDSAPPNKALVAAIFELEGATKEHRLAKNSNSAEWLSYTTRRLREANVRLLEVQ